MSKATEPINDVKKSCDSGPPVVDCCCLDHLHCADSDVDPQPASIDHQIAGAIVECQPLFSPPQRLQSGRVARRNRRIYHNLRNELNGHSHSSTEHLEPPAPKEYLAYRDARVNIAIFWKSA